MTQPLTTPTPTPETTPLTTSLTTSLTNPKSPPSLRNKKGRSPTSGSFKKGHNPWNKGIPMTEEQKLKLRQSFSTETRRKISEALKGNQNSLGRCHSEGTKKKIGQANSVALKTYYVLHPEAKARISESKKGNKNRLGMSHSEESKKKMSETHKHNKTNLGSHRSEETKKRMSEAQKGHPTSEETRQKISKAHKGKAHFVSEETKRKMSESIKRYYLEHPEALERLSAQNTGINNPQFGKALSEETRRKISEKLSGHPGWTKGKTAWNKGMHLSAWHKKKFSERMRQYFIEHPEAKDKLSEMNKGENHPQFGSHRQEMTKQKIARTLKGHSVSENTRTKISQRNKGKLAWNKGIPLTKEQRRKCSESRKRYIRENPEGDERIRRAALKQLCKRPNKKEQFLSSFLKDLGLTEFQYVGDGSLLINNKSPDFWNGDHKLLELWGTYWHRNQNPQDRIDFFKQRGYDCCVVWESELERSNLAALKEKLLNFTGRSG